MTGMNSYDDKRKRAVRRRNHVARDLAERKYHQRIVDSKKPKYKFLYWDEDYDESIEL